MESIREDLTANPRILVVCTGNICRSPMGEAVLRQRLEGAGLAYEVASCGVSPEEHGNPVYPPAARALEEAGYPVPSHSAHRATRAELRESGLILAMTTGHARALRRMCEQAGAPASRIHLWREFDGSGLDVAPEGCFGPGGALHDDIEAGYRSEFYYSLLRKVRRRRPLGRRPGRIPRDARRRRARSRRDPRAAEQRRQTRMIHLTGPFRGPHCPAPRSVPLRHGPRLEARESSARRAHRLAGERLPVGAP